MCFLYLLQIGRYDIYAYKFSTNIQTIFKFIKRLTSLSTELKHIIHLEKKI